MFSKRSGPALRTVFQAFRVARESPPLLRLLAMLQSSGHLLKKASEPGDSQFPLLFGAQALAQALAQACNSWR